MERATDTEGEISKGLIARIGQQGSLREGEITPLSFGLENLYLFDAETELVIR